MEKEGILGNKGVRSTELKEIIKQNEPIKEVQGLGTGLKRTSTANSVPMMASPQVEVFLDEVAEQLLMELDKSESQPETNKVKEI
jgi:hypothetical protein